MTHFFALGPCDQCHKVKILTVGADVGIGPYEKMADIS